MCASCYLSRYLNPTVFDSLNLNIIAVSSLTLGTFTIGGRFYIVLHVSRRLISTTTSALWFLFVQSKC